jgi:hypothetical protein
VATILIPQIDIIVIIIIVEIFIITRIRLVSKNRNDVLNSVRIYFEPIGISLGGHRVPSLYPNSCGPEVQVLLRQRENLVKQRMIHPVIPIRQHHPLPRVRAVAAHRHLVQVRHPTVVTVIVIVIAGNVVEKIKKNPKIEENVVVVPLQALQILIRLIMIQSQKMTGVHLQVTL